MRAAFATPVSKPGSLPPPFVAPGESCVTARSFSATPRAPPIPDVPGIAYLAPKWPHRFGRPEDLASDDDLSRWVEIGIAHARSLPPKPPAKAKQRQLQPLHNFSPPWTLFGLYSGSPLALQDYFLGRPESASGS